MIADEEKKAKRREYLRKYAQQWRRKNQDRTRTIQERYWQRRLERTAQTAEAAVQ